MGGGGCPYFKELLARGEGFGHIAFFVAFFLKLISDHFCVKGEVGNSILNTRGKIAVPPSLVCNNHTGVI